MYILLVVIFYVLDLIDSDFFQKQFKKILTWIRGRLCTNNSNSETTNSLPLTDYTEKVSPVVSTSCDVKYEYSFPHGLAVETASDNIYVADKFNCCIQIYNREGEYLYKFGDTRYPECITIHRAVALVSAENLITWFDLDGNYITQNKINEDDPRGIAVDEATGDTFVCEYSNNRILILMHENPFKVHFGNGILESPIAIQLTKENICVLSDSKFFFHLFNYDYIEVHKSTSYSICQQIYLPYGLAIDKHGNYIISCCSGLVIFDQRGDLLHKISKNVCSVKGVALDSKGRIILVASCNRLLIF